jgi:hypothetical protein
MSADALNKHTGSPEVTARYKAWLDRIGPELWSPTSKADYEQIRGGMQIQEWNRRANSVCCRVP